MLRSWASADTFIFSTYPQDHHTVMQSLVDIEQAVQNLSVEQQAVSASDAILQSDALSALPLTIARLFE